MLVATYTNLVRLGCQALFGFLPSFQCRPFGSMEERKDLPQILFFLCKVQHKFSTEYRGYQMFTRPINFFYTLKKPFWKCTRRA